MECWLTPACGLPNLPGQLLTLQELRALLGGSLRSAEAADVFSQLFASWSYSCAASLSLALLAQVGVTAGLLGSARALSVYAAQGLVRMARQVYMLSGCLTSPAQPPTCCYGPATHAFPIPIQAHTLAYELLAAMAQEPLSMRPETTVELTQLVSLLEAPAFAPLRLQLLQPQAYPALQRAVHGLLMLLPQVREGAAGQALAAKG